MATQTKIPLTIRNPWWGHKPSDKQLKALWAYEECPDLFYGGAAGPGKTSYLLMPWGCLGCCVPAEIRMEGSDSGVRQVLLRGSWESVLSWHTWSPGCGVHPLGGILRRGPPWPGLALAPGGEPVGAGARSWSSGRGGWRTYLMFVDLRTTSRHGDQPPSPRPLRDGAALARPLSWHQVRFPWGLLDSLDVCPFL